MPIKVVIDGGPGTGKTAVIRFLSKKYPIMKESAREILLKDKRFKHMNALQARGSGFQEAIFDHQIKEYNKSVKLKSKLVFFDRGLQGGLAYWELNNLSVPKRLEENAKSMKYNYVFILSPLPKKFYENDGARAESYKDSLKIHKRIIYFYKKYGLKPIIVPFNTVENRAKFVLSRIK